MHAEPTVDLVVAVHDTSRPIRRAVASVLEGTAPGRVRVTVVCHGIAAGSVAEKLDGLDGAALRILEFADGIRSPAGPFNFGLAHATAEYVAVMGSDDFLEPGAMTAWIRAVRASGADAALARLRHQDGAVLHNPLVRWRRSKRLDPVKDRLFYRTSPLGLLKRSTLEFLGLKFQEGVRSGMDMSYGARLWTSGARVDFLRAAPCYVIGADATTRVSTQPMRISESFRALWGIARSEWAANLAEPQRRALAVKLIRIHILGAVLARRTAADWAGDDLADLVAALNGVLALCPSALEPFARAERDLLDALPRGVERVVRATAAHARSGRSALVLPRDLRAVFDRESSFVRYLLYRLDPVGT